MSAGTRALEQVAASIADDDVVDWRLLARLPAPSARAGAGLRELSELARVFRGMQQPGAQPPTQPLFRFGPLDVLAPLGAGAQGELFRAYDRLLDLPVALKLRPSGADALAHRFLEEGRRLARVRHANVLSVYGAAVHDGRAGIWSELIEGTALPEPGPAHRYGGEELVSLGRELARALAAIHRQGLVHGDVKRENVMRARDGRIVLVDFGAAWDLELDGVRATVTGTPAYLAPEVLEGGAPTPASDLYALGVLLFRLASGCHPAPSDGAGRSVGDDRRRLRLAALRPDLPGHVVAAIEGLLGPVPDARPASAGEFERALDDPRPRRRALALAVAAAAALALTLWLARPAPAPWQPGIELRRVLADGRVQALRDGDTVAMGDRILLGVDVDRPSWIYVFDDDGRAPAVLFPLPDGGLRNPVSGDAGLVLPGPGRGGEPMAWQISSAAEREEIVVLASAHELPDVARAVAQWQHASQGDGATRGATTLVPAPLANVPDSAALRAVVTRARQDDGVRWWRLRLPHRAAP